MTKEKKGKRKQRETIVRQDEARRKSFTAIKNSMLGMGKKFSQGVEKAANILLDEEIKEKEAKGKDIKKETILMFKAISCDIKQNIRDITLKDILRDTYI